MSPSTQVLFVLALTIAAMLFSVGITNRKYPRRQLTLGRQPQGTVHVDFYRTYETKKFLFLEWKSYSISKPRLLFQLQWLNFWYERRLKFALGDIFDYDDPNAHIAEDDSVLLREFSESSDRNRNRISVLFSKKFLTNIFGRAIIDVPLGGRVEGNGVTVAPATVVTMSIAESREPLLDPILRSPLGVNNVVGLTLAHEIGHVIGFEHPTRLGSKGIARYTHSEACGLALRYPIFNREDVSDNIVNDPFTGVAYDNTDWNARTNMMTPFTPSQQLPQFYRVGIYRSNYEQVYDQITECWWKRSTT